jgi:hypothetical protein
MGKQVTVTSETCCSIGQAINILVLVAEAHGIDESHCEAIYGAVALLRPAHEAVGKAAG